MLPDNDDYETGESDFDSEAEALRDNQEADETKVLQPLPAALAARIPLEVKTNILDLVNSWPDLWLDMRLVCTAFRDHIEKRARTKWMRRADLSFRTSCWTFQRVEEDGTAVFCDDECADKVKARSVRACKSEHRPVVVLGYEAFYLDVPSIVYDWDNLAARVPWRNFVVCVMAEQNAFRQEMTKELLEHRRVAARGRHEMNVGRMSFEDGLESAFQAFLGSTHTAYESVHKRRYGKPKKKEMDHIKLIRSAVGWGSLESDEED